VLKILILFLNFSKMGERGCSAANVAFLDDNFRTRRKFSDSLKLTEEMSCSPPGQDAK